jgi:hypothetical protein
MKDGMNNSKSNDAIKRDKEWLKETILVEKKKTKLKQHNKYGWTLVDYLQMLRNKPKCGEWNYFVERFKQLPKNVQELILNKLHGGTKVLHIQHRTLTIDAEQN